MAVHYQSKQTNRRSSGQSAGSFSEQDSDSDQAIRSPRTVETIPQRSTGVYFEKKSICSRQVAIALWSNMFGERLTVTWLRTLGLCLVLLVMSTWGRTLINTDPVVTVDPDELSPVVFVPGHGGNQLEIKVDMEKPVLAHCQAKTDWTRSWLNLWQFIPGNMDCWAEYNSLVFDPTSGTYKNTPGVESRVPGWGHTDTIELLDPSFTAWMLGNVGTYGAPLIKVMKAWGYRSGETLLGAPYDFRYGSPSMPHNYYGNLRELVESAFKQRGKKVVLMAHSMGGLIAHHFLVQQSAEWKAQHIQALVTLSTPWKGALVMANAVVSGYTWGHDGLDSLLLRNAQRSSQSGFFIIPSPSEWGPDEVVVSTPTRNYTTRDYDQLFDDMGFPLGKDIWRDIRDVVNNLAHPGVDVFCLYSTGVPTPEQLVYGEGEFPDTQPHRVMGDGDGTVNMRSAKACRHMWEDQGDNIVYAMNIANYTHNGILQSKEAHNFLKEIVTNNID